MGRSFHYGPGHGQGVGKSSALLMVIVRAVGGLLWATGLTDKIAGATTGSSSESSSGADRPYDAVEMRVRNVADSGTFTATVVTTGVSYRQDYYAEEAKSGLWGACAS